MTLKTLLLLSRKSSWMLPRDMESDNNKKAIVNVFSCCRKQTQAIFPIMRHTRAKTKHMTFMIKCFVEFKTMKENINKTNEVTGIMDKYRQTENRKLCCSDGNIMTIKGMKFKKQAILASQIYICTCFNSMKLERRDDVGSDSSIFTVGKIGAGRTAFLRIKLGVCIL